MIRVIAGCLLAWVLAGCQGTGTSASPQFPAVSVREIFPSLEQEAREWKADAYLTEVDIRLKELNSGSVVASAGFQSPSEEHESVLVRLHPDNSVSSQVIAHELQVLQAEPIVLDDSVLDSAEALELALGVADPGTSSLVGSGCSFLTLERAFAIDPRLIIWRLVLRECLTPAAEQIRIDARTGELVPYP